MNKAYSTFEIKSVDEEQRIIEGIASTPRTDRQDDIVEPMGAVFALPLPALLFHDTQNPVASVEWAKPNAKDIPYRMRFPARGVLESVDKAWTLVKERLVRGVSIGFRPLESEPIKGSDVGGVRFKRWEWLELSLVVIPANADATISSIKSYDDQNGAASGAGKGELTSSTVRYDLREPRTDPPPGATGKQTKPASAGFFSSQAKGNKMRTVQEQISGFEAKRAANVGRNDEIMAKASEEGRTLDPQETEEYDNLSTEVKSIDDHLVRLKAHQSTIVETAKPVPAQAAISQDAGTKARTGVVQMGGHNLPKGIAFARYAMALAFSKGNVDQASKMAVRWKDSTPEVENVLRFAASIGGTDFVGQQMMNGGDMQMKAAIAAGTTTDATWASPLVQYTNMASEFVSLLYPKTILGQLTQIRRVPFNIRFPSQTAGATVGWVGQGAAKPVSKLAFATTTLGFAKAAGIVVITQELARFSSPSAEALVRDDLINTIAQFEDVQFISPGVAAVSNVSPASITNGVTPVQSGGATRALVDADVATMMAGMLSNNIPLTSLVWIMTPYNAMKLSMLRETNGEFSYPDINLMGGMWQGIPVIVSNNVPNSVSAGSIIVLVAQNEIFLADDGGVQLDASEQASLQMDSAPTNNGTGTPTATTLVSLWQDNLIGIRAEIIVNWQRRRDAAVAYLDNVHF